MGIRADLQAFLKGRAAISAVVGTRVYWLRAPQKEIAAGGAFVTFQRISGAREHLLHGTTRLATPVYQIDGWTKDPNQIEALSTGILGIDGFGGAMGSTTVRDVLLLSDRDLTEAPEGGSDVAWCRCSYDFEIWHEETVP